MAMMADAPCFKVCIVGSTGGVGQPLSLLMAMDPRVSDLCIYGRRSSNIPPEGVAADLAHINTKTRIKAFTQDPMEKPADSAGDCFRGCHLVLLTAGVARKPGQDRGQLLKTNMGIARDAVEACAKFCPAAMICIISNPVNSIVPAMCELWTKSGFDARKIVGVTTLDVVRANKFVHEATGASIEEIEVPVIGAHAGETILPLFSQDKAGRSISAEQIITMDKKVQNAGTEVLHSKEGRGSATLSMAFAGARLASQLLTAMCGQDITECAFVASTVTELPYFASRVTFGRDGVKKVWPLGPLSDHEFARLKELTPVLRREIDEGIKYASLNDLAF